MGRTARKRSGRVVFLVREGEEMKLVQSHANAEKVLKMFRDPKQRAKFWVYQEIPRMVPLGVVPQRRMAKYAIADWRLSQVRLASEAADRFHTPAVDGWMDRYPWAFACQRLSIVICLKSCKSALCCVIKLFVL